MSYDAQKVGGEIWASNRAVIGLDGRSYVMKAELYEATKQGKTTVKEVIEALYRERRNDIPTIAFLQWLKFPRASIEQYRAEFGQEVEYHHQNHPTTYGLIPLNDGHPYEGEEARKTPALPVIFDFREGEPFIRFKNEVERAIRRRIAGKRRRGKHYDNTEDFDFFEI